MYEYELIHKDYDRLWGIQGHGKLLETDKRNSHINRNVMAEDAESAIEKFKAECFSVKIISVNHKGSIHIK